MGRQALFTSARQFVITLLTVYLLPGAAFAQDGFLSKLDQGLSAPPGTNETIFSAPIKPIATYIYESYFASPPAPAPGQVSQSACIATVTKSFGACRYAVGSWAKDICSTYASPLCRWTDEECIKSVLTECVPAEIEALTAGVCTVDCNTGMKSCLGYAPGANETFPACEGPHPAPAPTLDFRYLLGVTTIISDIQLDRLLGENSGAPNPFNSCLEAKKACLANSADTANHTKCVSACNICMNQGLAIANPYFVAHPVCELDVER